jgi:hypothetical protein
LPSELDARGERIPDDFLQFQYEIVEALRQRAGIADEEVLKESQSDLIEKGPLNWPWVQAILRALDRRGGGMGRRALEIFTRDVFLYVTKPAVRRQIDRIVFETLGNEPAVVIGHSLGSVVGYSVLNSNTMRQRVPLYITLGSPLAIRAIRDNFVPITFPSTTAAWFNAFDPRDGIALNPLDRDNFRISPPIENYAGVINNTPDHHGIAGYLGDREVVRRILGALG